MRKLFFCAAVALLVALLQSCRHAPEKTEPSGLEETLSRLEGVVKLGPLQKAGNAAELFALINGGAAFYMKHGFIRALFQKYQDPFGRRIAIGVFEMQDTQAAHDVYRIQAGAVEEDQAVPLRLGESGLDSDVTGAQGGAQHVVPGLVDVVEHPGIGIQEVGLVGIPGLPQPAIDDFNGFWRELSLSHKPKQIA